MICEALGEIEVTSSRTQWSEVRGRQTESLIAATWTRYSGGIVETEKAK